MRCLRGEGWLLAGRRQAPRSSAASSLRGAPSDNNNILIDPAYTKAIRVPGRCGD